MRWTVLTCFLRFDGILLMFLRMLRDLPCHLQLWLEKGSYFTPHTTFTQNALKHEKMHSSSRPFNSKNVVFQSVHKWHLPIWKMPLQHFFQAWKVLKNSSNISKFSSYTFICLKIQHLSHFIVSFSIYAFVNFHQIKSITE